MQSYTTLIDSTLLPTLCLMRGWGWRQQIAFWAFIVRLLKQQPKERKGEEKKRFSLTCAAKTYGIVMTERRTTQVAFRQNPALRKKNTAYRSHFGAHLFSLWVLFCSLKKYQQTNEIFFKTVCQTNVLLQETHLSLYGGKTFVHHPSFSQIIWCFTYVEFSSRVHLGEKCFKREVPF